MVNIFYKISHEECNNVNKENLSYNNPVSMNQFNIQIFLLSINDRNIFL